MGPLHRVRVLEFAGIGPGPFCAMLLSDMGAEVLRIGRPGAPPSDGVQDVLNRGRRAVAFDLKQPAAVQACLRLVERADMLIEGFRPGVMERLALGPDECLARNPRLVYGRMTGWGQHGPLAQTAGHDINYIALTGLLHAIGRRGDKPVPPLNVAGDFGGGALYLAMGLCAALFEAQRSGLGQVVDAAMTDGAASLMAMVCAMRADGAWSDRRGDNLLDTGAHFYDTYETADGKYIALGALEPQFYALLRARLGLDDDLFDDQMARQHWPARKEQVAAVVKTKTRDQWCAVMDGADACFAPVLSLDEAPAHPHNAARSTFVEVAGVMQPNVAPRFSRTVSSVQGPPPQAPDPTVLADWGLSAEEIDRLA